MKRYTKKVKHKKKHYKKSIKKYNKRLTKKYNRKSSKNNKKYNIKGGVLKDNESLVKYYKALNELKQEPYVHYIKPMLADDIAKMDKIIDRNIYNKRSLGLFSKMPVEVIEEQLNLLTQKLKNRKEEIDMFMQEIEKRREEEIAAAELKDKKLEELRQKAIKKEQNRIKKHGRSSVRRGLDEAVSGQISFGTEEQPELELVLPEHESRIVTSLE